MRQRTEDEKRRRAEWNAIGNEERKFCARLRVSTVGRITFGGLAPDTPPCSRCGCAFVNVGCPKSWPIGTVALTCSMCGRVRDYIDGLYIMSVSEALLNQHGRDWIVRHRTATYLSDQYEVNPQVVELALEAGMTIEEIATALDVGALL